MKLKLQSKQISLTADKIHSMSHNFPNILKTIYTEDRDRSKDQSVDEMVHLEMHLHRKGDMKYNKMLESKTRKKA